MLNLNKQEQLRHRYQSAINPGHRFGLDIYREWLATLITPESDVLDIGCGPAGLVADYEQNAHMVVGIDEYLTNFTEFDGQFGITRLAESRINALPFKDETFDFVTSSWVLEHLQNPLDCMAEVARVLKPGGRFMFITPNALNYVVMLRRLVPELLSKSLVKMIYDRDEDFINPTFYQMNTPDDVNRICQQVGLEQKHLEIVSDPTYLALNEPLFQLSIVLERLLITAYPQSLVHLVGMYRKPISGGSR